MKAETSINKYTAMPLKSIAALFIVCSLAASSEADSQQSGNRVDSGNKSPNTVAQTKPWEGVAGGYVSTGEPATDRKMVPLKLGEKLSVTASDVYRLAEQAQTAGERFPTEDSSDCL